MLRAIEGIAKADCAKQDGGAECLESVSRGNAGCGEDWYGREYVGGERAE